MNAVSRLQPVSGARVAFGAPAAGVELEAGVPCLRLAVPVLAGSPDEILTAGGVRAIERHGCHLFDIGVATVGFAVAVPGADLEVATGDLYRRLFAATDGLHLHRVWNYVPGINAIAAGLENYQRFSRQRSLAFEERFGRGYSQHLPAASAVGTLAGPLAIEFIAGRAEPRRFENPRQVPAFEYPREYGPRSPSFTRATVVTDGGSRRTYISGTAAISGHVTVAVNDLPGQIECTLTNLRAIGETAGAGADLGREDRRAHRSFRVYLRHAADLPRVQPALERELLRSGDVVSWLQADICRRDLLLEIEAGIAVAIP